MKQHPILFCGEMVRAILEDRKHQTRRMHGLKDINKEPDAYRFGGMHKAPSLREGLFAIFVKGDSELLVSPKYQPGDRLWVKETAYISKPNFADPSPTDLIDENGKRRVVGYAASMDGDAVRCATDYGVKKSPSIFMPRWASRITLEVTAVRCQRVHDISEYDAVDEGVNLAALTAVEVYKSPERSNRPAWFAFANLWQSINNNWDANPYVFAYTFRKI